MRLSCAAEARQFRGAIEDFGPLEKEQSKAIRKGLKVMCRECQMGVAAAQRLSLVLSIVGGRVFFKEGDFRRRLAAGVLILAGVFLVAWLKW